MINKKFMEQALTIARKNLKEVKGGPFGACIVKNDKVISLARNTVLTGDATAHAEINAIRSASRKLKTFDLSGCEIYSTTEPCPMCFSAIHWAGIKRIIYGTTITDVKKLGFRELAISNAEIKKKAKLKIKIEEKIFYKECMSLLKDWQNLKNKKTY